MIEWVLSASLLILVVLLLRAALGKRISAGLRYGLWAVVLVRLLVPVSLFALPVRLPAWEVPERFREESIYVLPVASAPVENAGVYVAEDGTLLDVGSFGYARLEDEGRTVTRYAEKISPMELLGWVWLAGGAATGAALLACNLQFIRRLKRVRKPLEGVSAPAPVYVAPGLPSPCLMGGLRPAVYVTEAAAGDPVMLRHVLVHELTHYNHRDHLWSVLRGVALAVHWWNPLVWLAVVCSRRDGELACDEGALKQLGDGERNAYGETLLSMVTAKSKPGDLLCVATTMSGGKRNLAERIRRIASRPKRLVGAMAAAVAVLSLAAVCAFGRAQARGPDPLLQPLGLCWNDSMDTVIGKLGIKEEQIFVNEKSAAQQSGFEEWDLQVHDVPFLGYEATVGFVFTQYDGAAGGYGLRNMTVILPEDADMAKIREELTVQYGTGEAGKMDPTAAWAAILPNAREPQPDRENHHMYWTAGWEAMPEDYGERVWDWLVNIEYKSVDPEKLELYRTETQVAALYWTDDWPLLSDILTANRVTFDATQLVRFLQNVPLDAPESVNTQASPYDVNRDGIREGISGSTAGYAETTQLTQGDGEDRQVIWSKTLDKSAGSWDVYFRCRVEGLDYLLAYSPKIQDGSCDYSFRLFHLEDGEEVTDRESQIAFDMDFGSPDHRFDPAEIAAFMCEVNSYIAAGGWIAGSDLGTLHLEELSAGVWRDNILVTLGARETDYGTEEELRDRLADYANYAGDHPDGVWSPLEDLLANVTETSVKGFRWDAAELVRCLKAAERGSRFYEWESATDASLGHADVTAESNIVQVLFTDGSELRLFDLESGRVLMVLETEEGVVSAFYDAPELYAYLTDIFQADS